MSRHLLTDTGFWIALYHVKDEYHAHAKGVAKDLGNQRVLVPWPCLYEALSTHLVNRPDRVIFLRELFQKLPIHRVDDLPYREIALKDTIDELSPYSLADNVIRLMLNDPSLRIATFVTYNSKDFWDICIKKKTQLVTYQGPKKRK